MGWGLLEQARPPCTPPPSWAQHRRPIQPLTTITRESHFMVKEHFSVCSPPGPEKSAEWVEILSHHKYSSYVLHFPACNFVFLPTALSLCRCDSGWLNVQSMASYFHCGRKKFATEQKQQKMMLNNVTCLSHSLPWRRWLIFIVELNFPAGMNKVHLEYKSASEHDDGSEVKG